MIVNNDRYYEPDMEPIDYDDYVERTIEELMQTGEPCDPFEDENWAYALKMLGYTRKEVPYFDDIQNTPHGIKQDVVNFWWELARESAEESYGTE
jgi:hypothetical protein